MVPQSYKGVIDNSNEISVWTILSRLLHARDPHLGGTNSDVQSDLATLAFNNEENLKYFHCRIVTLQQESNLSGETVSSTRLLFQYTNEFSNIDKIKAFIAPKIKDITTFIYYNKNWLSTQEKKIMDYIVI